MGYLNALVLMGQRLMKCSRQSRHIPSQGTAYRYNKSRERACSRKIIYSLPIPGFIHYSLSRSSRESLQPIPLTVVLSSATSGKYFGRENPLGEVITIELFGEKIEFTVTGVYEGFSFNTPI
jgi:ABC-type antimicrobial peptide transport system permease subunit